MYGRHAEALQVTPTPAAVGHCDRSLRTVHGHDWRSLRIVLLPDYAALTTSEYRVVDMSVYATRELPYDATYVRTHAHFVRCALHNHTPGNIVHMCINERAIQGRRGITRRSQERHRKRIPRQPSQQMEPSSEKLVDSDELDLDADLQCSICLDFFFEPLTLECSHTFCRVCLLKSTKLAPDGRSCPQCRAVITIVDPLKHPEDANIAVKVAEIIPAAQVELRRVQYEDALSAIAKQNSSDVPIFIMRAGRDSAFQPGAPISLHFFEPRYRVLIRRAWEGNRVFVWAQAAPSGSSSESLQTALLVAVDSARFLPDGRATIVGRGVERVALDRCWVEEGTGGLWYTTVRSASAAALSSIVSSDRDRGESRIAEAVGSASILTTAQRLRGAISRGAPAYNRGEVRRCADIYLLTAREEMRSNLSTHVAEVLRRAVEEADALLAEADRAPSAASSSSARVQVDSAAWALRHAFDEVIASAASVSTASASAASASGAAREMTREMMREMPLFYYDGLSLADGARADFTLFEPRYRILAEEVERGGLLLIASVPRSSSPSAGQAATVARMESCVWQEAGEERRAHVSLLGVRCAELRTVRECTEKAGLWYAHADVSGDQEGDGGCSTCCTVC